MSDRTAPTPTLLPSEAWTLLSVFVFLFASTGLLICLGALVFGVGKLVGWAAVAEYQIHPLVFAINTSVGVAYLWTPVLLNKAKRLGGYLALGSFGLSALAPWRLG